MPPPPASQPFRARQLRPALRSRMRGGRLTDLACKPLADCTIYDTLDNGIGVIVATNANLPARLLLHDDLDVTIAEARVLWREGRQLALALETDPVGASLFSMMP
ncbi:hypothetical protein [Pannonibacter sp.]|uniref:hypothetical protein n=1 Tax=Pannonibacter sp. TaxID=1906786 RepID=UPI003F706CED